MGVVLAMHVCLTGISVINSSKHRFGGEIKKLRDHCVKKDYHAKPIVETFMRFVDIEFESQMGRLTAAESCNRI